MWHICLMHTLLAYLSSSTFSIMCSEFSKNNPLGSYIHWLYTPQFYALAPTISYRSPNWMYFLFSVLLSFSLLNFLFPFLFFFVPFVSLSAPLPISLYVSPLNLFSHPFLLYHFCHFTPSPPCLSVLLHFFLFLPEYTCVAYWN